MTAKGPSAAQKAAPAAETTKATTAKKSPAKKAPAVKASAGKSPAKKAPAERTTAEKKSAETRTARKKAEKTVQLGGQEWTTAEIDALRNDLTSEIERLRAELAEAQEHLEQLREGQSAASGEDPVDTGTHASERENELSIVSHANGTIQQCEDALARLQDGTYGICEACGKPIAKLRLQAFPKARTCIECKKLQERR